MQNMFVLPCDMRKVPVLGVLAFADGVDEIVRREQLGVPLPQPVLPVPVEPGQYNQSDQTRSICSEAI